MLVGILVMVAKELINQCCHGTRKTRNLNVHFSRQGKQGINVPKILKECFYTGNLSPTQGNF